MKLGLLMAAEREEDLAQGVPRTLKGFSKGTVFEGSRSDTKGIERKEPGKPIFLENPRLDRLIVRSAAARTAK
jgi:hypothetical protein